MAYAKLVFPSGTHSLKKLKEIARFATGQISSLANLEFANQSLSEISIVDEPGWTNETATSFEATGTATRYYYNLNAPCVDSSKIKKFQMIAVTRRDDFYNLGTQNTRYDYQGAVGSTATTGFLVSRTYESSDPTTGNADVGSTTWYFNYLIAYGIINNNHHVYATIPATSLSETTIYISCSSRKLIIFSPEASGRSDYISALEFPETQDTKITGNIPALCSQSRYSNTKSYAYSGTNIFYGYRPAGTGTKYTYHYVYSNHQLLNWKINSDNTIADRRHLNSHGINNIESNIAPASVFVYGSTASLPLIPLVNDRNATAENYQNYSELTDFYLTNFDTSYGVVSEPKTFSYNGVPYIVLPNGDASSNYRYYAIKKG
jgi:hypothetical protein